MYALKAIIIVLFGLIACTQASGIGLAGSVDSAAIIAGPSGTVQRTGLASVGPIAAPGAIITGPALSPAGLVAPGLISAGLAPGAILGGPALGIPGLGLGLGGPGLTAKLLGLEGSGIEGQYVPDLTEKLYDDGSYRPGLYGH